MRQQIFIRAPGTLKYITKLIIFYDTIAQIPTNLSVDRWHKDDNYFVTLCHKVTKRV